MTTQLDRDPARSKRKLLLFEASLLALLLQKRSTAAEAAIGRGLDPGPAIYDAVRSTLFTGRQLARGLGREALDARYGTTRAAPQIGALIDAQRAEIVARRHLQHIVAAAAKARGDENPERWRKGLKATEWRAETVAATESFSAANVERDQAARQVSLELGIELWKQWNAYGDACPVCSGEDGTVIRVTEAFSAGEPGSVHPNCHCWTEIQEHP